MLTFSDYQKKKTGKKLHESTKEDNPDIIELVKELDHMGNLKLKKEKSSRGYAMKYKEDQRISIYTVQNKEPYKDLETVFDILKKKGGYKFNSVKTNYAYANKDKDTYVEIYFDKKDPDQIDTLTFFYSANWYYDKR